jgi:hypothetical protein
MKSVVVRNRTVGEAVIMGISFFTFSLTLNLLVMAYKQSSVYRGLSSFLLLVQNCG